MSDQTNELPAGTWPIDHAHSTVSFIARHLMVTKVRGQFKEFDGTVEIAPNVLDSKISASVNMSSVTTGEDKRDEHLRSADFFESDEFPNMDFKSTSIKAEGDGEYKLLGDLTVHGVTQPVEFDVEFNGTTGDPWGGTRAGFSATGEISRKAFGLEWNASLETGGVLVSDKIQIELEIQATKPA